jgi:hypothetical protein
MPEGQETSCCTPQKVIFPVLVRINAFCERLHFVLLQDGFYRTLKRRARTAFAGVPRGPNYASALIADLLALGSVAFSVLAACSSSYAVGALAGVLIALNVVSAHNFLHQKDNFRMYYFNLSFMSFRCVV